MLSTYHICPTCQGNWFNQRDIKYLIDLTHDLSLPDVSTVDIKRIQKSKRNLCCPDERHILYGLNYSGVEIDICMSCHGVWLDKDEKDKIITNLNKVNWWEVIAAICGLGYLS